MHELIAAFTVLAFRIQQPVHGADGTMILAVIQKGSVNLRGRTVLEALLVKASQHSGLLTFFQAARRGPLRSRNWRRKAAPAAPVNSRSGNGEVLASAPDSNHGAEFIDGRH
jgi:hypothetical protein